MSMAVLSSADDRQKVKQRCGENFLIEISCSGQEPEADPGVTIDDTIQLAKEIDGYIDLLQIRGTFIDPSQPTYLNPKRIPHLETTAAIKEGAARWVSARRSR